MASLKLTDLTKATRLLDRLVAKADVNGDGAIRAGDVDRIRNQPGVGRITRGSGNETQLLTVTLDTFRRSAASQGGPHAGQHSYGAGGNQGEAARAGHQR
jgi:hypothetical protein